jgi:hypothetical protein
MSVQDKPNEQFIITYEDNRGKLHAYTSAYTRDECNHYLLKCLNRYGRGCNAKYVPGKELTIHND